MERRESQDSFRISKFVFMQSLEPQEFQTGTQLAEYVNMLASDAQWPISIDQYSAPDFEGFRQALEHLLEQAENGELPWLHIDAHGSDDYGLHFADGTSMLWSELCERLALINAATRFRLFVFVSTCYGAAIVTGMSTISPAPCLALIGPTQVVDPGELYNRCMTFYRSIVGEQDIGRLLTLLQATNWRMVDLLS